MDKIDRSILLSLLDEAECYYSDIENNPYLLDDIALFSKQSIDTNNYIQQLSKSTSVLGKLQIIKREEDKLSYRKRSVINMMRESR